MIAHNAGPLAVLQQQMVRDSHIHLMDLNLKFPPYWLQIRNADYLWLQKACPLTRGDGRTTGTCSMLGL